MNRHPVDRMYDIKREIAELQDEYDGIRNRVLTGDISRTGDECEANVNIYQSRRTNFEEAERLLSEDMYNQIVSTSESIHVRVKKLNDKGRN